jgi:two-component system, NtrC family, sensor kinase
MYNKTLERQLKKFQINPERVAKKYLPLLKAVSDSYEHYDSDRVMLERSMDLSSRELTELNQKFRSQNEQLESQKEAIERAFEELKTTQTQLVQSEKMAALGQLIAGVAHEINTPLGAINAAAGVLAKMVPQALQQQPQLFKEFTSPDEEIAFNLFVENSLNANTSLSTREERQYIRDITDLFKAQNVPNASNVAMKIVRAGIYNDLDAYMPILKHEHSAEIIDLAMNIGRIRVNIENVATAVAKTQKIVFALKSYAYRKTENAATEITSLVDNISTVLTLYHNQLKYGVETTFNYAGNLPDIECFPDELNQVWTNIIHNAIQAMGGKGSLTIDVQPADNDTMKVQISDNGPGIPAEIIDKIFVPFFTTKRQGEGSGLGLDICRKIVEKHNGKISVESEPGRTVFTVFLPVKQPIPAPVA